MSSVLVVCVGNICRSPLAERLLAARAEASGVDVSVSSAGVRALAGERMDDLAAAELVRLGGSPAGFVARRLTEEMVAGADLVLAATKGVRTEVLNVAPGAMRRTFTLLEFAALCEVAASPAGQGVDELVADVARARGRVSGVVLDVADPVDGSPRLHRAVAETIAAAVDRIVTTLAH